MRDHVTRNHPTVAITGLVILSIVLLVAVMASATTVVKVNVEQMISHGDVIIVGHVVGLSDGFDANNIPYTKVTVNVSQSLKGGVNGNYSFRLFGLLAPREVNGRTYLGVSPDGWPKFAMGEKVMLFMHGPSSLGFQSPVGLMQGKFTMDDSEMCNAINNMGLFKDVTVDPSQLTDAEQKLLDVEQGPVRAESFVSFVEKAVANNWFNN